MIDLTQHTTIADYIAINFNGPGFYSGKVKSDLAETIVLEKISDLGVNPIDAKHFAKINKYKVVPVMIQDIDDIPESWEIISDRFEDLVDYLD